MNYNINSCIKNTVSFGNDAGFEDKKPFHITYGVDKRYQLGVAISIVSVLINNRNSFCFHIFTDECSDEYLNKIKDIAENFSTCINIYYVDPAFFHTLPSTKVWSHAMYYRLLAYDWLNSEIERVLYLDADVMCAGNLSALFQLDFSGNVAAVVDDFFSTKESSIVRLGSKLKDKQHYFNSGVMLVNLRIWQEESLTEKALNMLLDPALAKEIKYPDQDVLNIILSERLIFLERKYNTIYTLKAELKDKTHKKYTSVINDSTVLVHYTGVTKPWHSWGFYPSGDIFNIAWNSSPWRNSPRQSAETVSEMQKEYKHYFAYGKYRKGIFSLLKYKLKKSR
ncbi:glycosyltransferase family 8 protein [Leminorella richardii]|nr:glycosyltransferase [Leminorella richardii]